MKEVIVEHVLKVQEKSELEQAIISACGSERCTVSQCRKALIDLQIGLSNFQLSVIVGEAEESDDGTVDVALWAPKAAVTIEKLVYLDDQQLQRREAAAREIAATSEPGLVCGVPAYELYDKLYNCFQLYDKDQSGFLEKAEFMTALDEDDIGLTQNQKVALMRSADVDADGRVSYGEFVDLAVSSFVFWIGVGAKLLICYV